MPPIEGGQSLAEAEPKLKRGPFFSAASGNFWERNVDFGNERAMMGMKVGRRIGYGIEGAMGA
jgi:hypothetical protein